MISAQRLFQALGAPTSHRIVTLLVDGERCACEIPRMIKRTQPNTSMHLAKLRRLGVLRARRDGKMMVYAIHDARVRRLLRAAR